MAKPATESCGYGCVNDHGWDRSNGAGGAIPLYGDAHDTKPDLKAIRTWFTPLGHRIGIVNVRFGKLTGGAQVVSATQLYSDGEWEGIVSTILSQQVTRDRNDVQMQITYTGTPWPGSILFNSALQIPEAVREFYLPTYLLDRKSVV